MGIRDEDKLEYYREMAEAYWQENQRFQVRLALCFFTAAVIIGVVLWCIN